MKRSYLALLLVLIITSCKKDKISIQAVEQLESYTTSRLNRVTCFDNNICIVCGGERFYSAEVIRSTDNGNSWSKNEYPDAGKGLYGMAISPSGTIYLTGYDGKLLTSYDQGENWSFRQVAYWRFYLSAASPSNDILILGATDAQNSSSVVRIDSNNTVIDTAYFKFGLNDVFMSNSSTGYLAGYGAIMKTTDAGKSWQYQDVKNDNFMGIHCVDENNVWTCGYGGSIFRTRNGGGSWQRLRNGNNLLKKSYALLNIYFKDVETGWACGEKGLLLGTTDGGDTWKEYESFTEDALRDITTTTDGKLLVVGDNGTMYKLTL